MSKMKIKIKINGKSYDIDKLGIKMYNGKLYLPKGKTLQDLVQK